MNDKSIYEKFISEMERNVLSNIDKAFHEIVAECPQPEISSMYCHECAEYLKNRLDGYIDAAAALIGQSNESKSSYLKTVK